MRSRNTRRATAVAAMATGALAGGAATAAAAPFPISIAFTGGTVTAGSLPAAVNATPGAPASFAGTIESDTFIATFPASTIILPEATLQNVAVGSVTASTLAIDATPTTAFTGTVSVSPLTMNLSGSIRYRFVATVPKTIGTGNDTFSCTLTPAVPVTFNGTEINLATGAYGAAGSSAASPAVPDDLASTPFCLQLSTKVAPGSSVASSFTGTLTIPGLIPTPKPTTPAVLPPTTTTTATAAPTTPTGTTTKVGRLKVSIAKPKTVRRGSSTIAKVTVRNTGTGTARGVKLTVKLPSRTTTRNSRTKSWTAIGAGSTRSYSVRVRTTKRTAKRTTIRATAVGAGGLKATGSVRLALR